MRQTTEPSTDSYINKQGGNKAIHPTVKAVGFLA